MIPVPGDGPAPVPDPLPARLRALAPSCGPVRLVAVDGHAGSGKSTLAARLSAGLGGAPVAHLDDFARHDAFFSWVPELTERLLRPLAAGRAAAYRAYDWERGAPGRAVTVAPAPVVLLEGVGAGRRALRPWLALLIWMDVPAELAWQQGRLRDGPAQSRFWDRWQPAEREHFAEDPSRPHADILVARREGGDHAVG